MSKVLTVDQIQNKINNIESRYYKGCNQSEEWWRISGDVSSTDRRLWTYYHNLLNKRKEQLGYKEKYEQLAEQLVGDDATDRYNHQELINEVNRLKDIEENENDKKIFIK
tara:strand:- start:2737 stop:3066 length:330 start_codon:yes stop_codon:yes gene_type:complete